MAAKKKGGMYEKNPFNETSGGSGPEAFDESGGGLYGSWDEIMDAHLSMADGDMESTPNLKSGAGIMGGPAPGEPNPVDYSTTTQSKGSK